MDYVEHAEGCRMAQERFLLDSEKRFRLSIRDVSIQERFIQKMASRNTGCVGGSLPLLLSSFRTPPN